MIVNTLNSIKKTAKRYLSKHSVRNAGLQGVKQDQKKIAKQLGAGNKINSDVKRLAREGFDKHDRCARPRITETRHLNNVAKNKQDGQ